MDFSKVFLCISILVDCCILFVVILNYLDKMGDK